MEELGGAEVWRDGEEQRSGVFSEQIKWKKSISFL